MDAAVAYKNGVGVVAGSHNVKSVTNVGAGLWDVVFAYTSRTTTANRFLVQAHIALNDTGSVDAGAPSFGADTVTIRVNTRNLAGVDADKSFNCSIKELG